MKPSDAWSRLKEFTTARVALGRTGNSLPSDALLHFRKDHAQARDAVWTDINYEEIKSAFEKRGLPYLKIQSCAPTRKIFIQRPDLGRIPDEDSIQLLKDHADPTFELSISIAEGLSAIAIAHHALPFLDSLLPSLHYKLAPVTLIKQGRVAISDVIGQQLGAVMSIILIGERPGLSSINSMGVYMTYHPRAGNTDEKRNCISNIRPEGLSYKYAARKLNYLLDEAMRKKISGVNLKDNFDNQLPE